MIHRTISQKLVQLFQKFPILAVLGPRQSGKTTLVKEIFPDHPYVNLEDLSKRAHAMEDPKDFLDAYKDGLIIDEVQYVPSLFSYIQLYSDQKDKPGLYVLTGSQQFFLNEKITQSLAGRVVIANLLPLSYGEIKSAGLGDSDPYTFIFKGFYPRIYRYDISPNDFYPSYIQTYVERDVRQIQNVSDLVLFQKFLKLCAGRIGQLLNLSSLANDCGISHVTAKHWISLLEMSFIVYLLKPHHKNFNKRLVKSPKLYFYDTGIASNLLDIMSASQLETHYAKGSLFENFAISEFLKVKYNQGRASNLYFWRDKVGHEIDLILDAGEKLIPVEIKSSKTINSDFFINLKYWESLSRQDKAYLVYGGNENERRKNVNILSWSDLSSMEVGF